MPIPTRAAGGSGLTIVKPARYLSRALMPACSHPDAQVVRLFAAQDYVTGQHFEVAQCPACGLAVTRPRPSLMEMPQYYPSAYYGDPAEQRFPKMVEWLQNVLYAHRARRVEQLNGGRIGRVLDIGCGRGLLLRAFQRRGWEVQGTELSEQAAQYARFRLKLPVQTGPLEELHFADNSFDAVVMWHVMEHVPDPRALITEVQRLLKSGGIFMVAVPDFGSLEARLARDKWFHLDVPRHLVHFTRQTLREALTAAAFEVRHQTGLAPEYDCFSFVQSVLNRLGLRHNLLYHLLRHRGAKVLQDGKAWGWQILLTLLLAPLLGLVSLLATTLAGVCGRGATITLYAQKRPATA